MRIMTKELAADIWAAHNEVENGNRLLTDLAERVRKGEAPNLRDAFGRSQCLQLGIPSGENCHRLVGVQPALAETIIRAHIAEKKAQLEALSFRAYTELGQLGQTAEGKDLPGPCHADPCDTKTPNMDYLREQVTKLKALLDDPETERATWITAYRNCAKALINFWQDEPGELPELPAWLRPGATS